LSAGYSPAPAQPSVLFSLDELNSAIPVLLGATQSAKPFRKLRAPRNRLRQSWINPALRPLPKSPMSSAEWEEGAGAHRLTTSSSMGITNSVPYQTGEEAAGGALTAA